MKNQNFPGLRRLTLEAERTDIHAYLPAVDWNSLRDVLAHLSQACPDLICAFAYRGVRVPRDTYAEAIRRGLRTTENHRKC